MSIVIVGKCRDSEHDEVEDEEDKELEEENGVRGWIAEETGAVFGDRRCACGRWCGEHNGGFGWQVHRELSVSWLLRCYIRGDVHRSMVVYFSMLVTVVKIMRG